MVNERLNKPILTKIRKLSVRKKPYDLYLASFVYLNILTIF